MRNGSKHGEASPFSDKIVFSQVKEGLGGNLRIILSGAAPLSAYEWWHVVMLCKDMVSFFTDCLTETCAGTFASLPNELSMLSTMGPLVLNVDVRLESVPEMGYDALASTPRGEICQRGKTLFTGYYKREDLTNEVMVDGWFHTEDIGEWKPNGSMKVIDRKNIFKLLQWEYVAVENLENVYDSASVVESQALERWAADSGVSGELESIYKDPKAKEYILGELTKTGKEKQLEGFEFIKAVHLDHALFDMDHDLPPPHLRRRGLNCLSIIRVVDEMYKSANKPNA
ncbi:Long chain acyl-CoA synthetase 5 [Hibiscus syriacus]|uniref:Long chain acyl-CoA synthetase 5 n=1 Tax=Hibiscus syriacus TaxID=106335 RepID=A0A6A2ZQ02_HIBSY|nr:Long chain acyl-CoA synthetase 5 [Hibiscus syriacus]